MNLLDFFIDIDMLKTMFYVIIAIGFVFLISFLIDKFGG